MMPSNIGSAFLSTLLVTERSSEDQLKSHQDELLHRLYRHARSHVDYYGGRPAAPTSSLVDTDFWARQPFVTRECLAANPDSFCARHVPENHGAVQRVTTGGTSGKAVSRLFTALESLGRTICFYRALSNWGYEYSHPLIFIRNESFAPFFQGSDGVESARQWNLPAVFGEKNPSEQYYIDICARPDVQLARVLSLAPANINTFPSNLLRLAHCAQNHVQKPYLPIIISVSEYLAPEIRSFTEESFSSRVLDIISSAEAGIIATQCSASHLYHIQSELVLVEIVDAAGEPCAIGEIGELVVTPLYNYATPLLRYRTGDYVERGPACPCGRTLPTISRFVGRIQHMFSASTGVLSLPKINRVEITRRIGHDRWIFVQTKARRAELRVESLASVPVPNELRSQMMEYTNGNFEVSIIPSQDLPLTTGGKTTFYLELTLSL